MSTFARARNCGRPALDFLLQAGRFEQRANLVLHLGQRRNREAARSALLAPGGFVVGLDLVGRDEDHRREPFLNVGLDLQLPLDEGPDFIERELRRCSAAVNSAGEANRCWICSSRASIASFDTSSAPNLSTSRKRSASRSASRGCSCDSRPRSSPVVRGKKRISTICEISLTVRTCRSTMAAIRSITAAPRGKATSSEKAANILISQSVS